MHQEDHLLLLDQLVAEEAEALGKMRVRKSPSSTIDPFDRWR
jgi:hypothetical protein